MIGIGEKEGYTGSDKGNGNDPFYMDNNTSLFLSRYGVIASIDKTTIYISHFDTSLSLSSLPQSGDIGVSGSNAANFSFAFRK